MIDLFLLQSEVSMIREKQAAGISHYGLQFSSFAINAPKRSEQTSSNSLSYVLNHKLYRLTKDIGDDKHNSFCNEYNLPSTAIATFMHRCVTPKEATLVALG
eukprot:GHVU01118463.1.p2 GENE.GHVU01118463.1~~GHVU01118463.1.p2  ORF type:complete len:102 (-),score=6.95 GHVU01118463.1:179-484(-)